MTTAKQTETLLDPEQSARLLNSFFQIADVMNAKHLSYNNRLDRVLKVVLQYLNTEKGSLMVIERDKLIILASSRPELVGHEQLLDEDSVASWVVKTGNPLYIPDISQDKRFKKREGKYKKDSLLSAPILHEGQVLGVINASDKTGKNDLLKEDISCLLRFSSFILWSFMQQNLHNKLRKQRNTLKKRNKELKHQEAMRAQLSSMLIHDMKAPLSEVVANLDILSYSIGEDGKEFLEGAQMGCDRAVRMLSNLVAIDQIADGKLKPLYEPADPQELLSEVFSGIKALAQIKGITLVQEVADNSLLNIDRVLILRVLQNLLTNSLGYAEAGSIIRAGCRRVVGKKRVEFFVEDQGPGIPLDKQDYIFDKYARISTRQDALVGSGLGLHFCKLAVELHRGKIGVQSAEGKGSRFFFSLPVK